jgi:hypothetical protein
MKKYMPVFFIVVIITLLSVKLAQADDTSAPSSFAPTATLND